MCLFVCVCCVELKLLVHVLLISLLAKWLSVVREIQ